MAEGKKVTCSICGGSLVASAIVRIDDPPECPRLYPRAAARRGKNAAEMCRARAKRIRLNTK